MEGKDINWDHVSQFDVLRKDSTRNTTEYYDEKIKRQKKKLRTHGKPKPNNDRTTVVAARAVEADMR